MFDVCVRMFRFIFVYGLVDLTYGLYLSRVLKCVLFMTEFDCPGVTLCA